MKKLFLILFIILMCKPEKKEEIVIIIEEPIKEDTLQREEKPKKTLSLEDAVVLLKKDLEKRDRNNMLKNTRKIKKEIKKLKKKAEKKLSYLLSMYILRLERIEKILKKVRFKSIGPNDRIKLEKELEAIEGIVKRIKES